MLMTSRILLKLFSFRYRRVPGYVIIRGQGTVVAGCQTLALVLRHEPPRSATEPRARARPTKRRKERGTQSGRERGRSLAPALPRRSPTKQTRRNPCPTPKNKPPHLSLARARSRAHAQTLSLSRVYVCTCMRTLRAEERCVK